jgi:hypothetical protein
VEVKVAPAEGDLENGLRVGERGTRVRHEGGASSERCYRNSAAAARQTEKMSPAGSEGLVNLGGLRQVLVDGIVRDVGDAIHLT